MFADLLIQFYWRAWCEWKFPFLLLRKEIFWPFDQTIQNKSSMKWKICRKELWNSCGWSKSNNLSHSQPPKATLGLFSSLNTRNNRNSFCGFFTFLPDEKKKIRRKRFLFHMCVTVIYVLGQKTHLNSRNSLNAGKLSLQMTHPRKIYSKQKSFSLRNSREFLKKSLFPYSPRRMQKTCFKFSCSCLH